SWLSYFNVQCRFACDRELGSARKSLVLSICLLADAGTLIIGVFFRWLSYQIDKSHKGRRLVHQNGAIITRAVQRESQRYEGRILRQKISDGTHMSELCSKTIGLG